MRSVGQGRVTSGKVMATLWWGLTSSAGGPGPDGGGQRLPDGGLLVGEPRYVVGLDHGDPVVGQLHLQPLFSIRQLDLHPEPPCAS